MLRGYQIKGFSASRNPSGWKLFSVSKISNLKIEDESFAGNRPRYNLKDSAMRIVFCNI